MKTKLLFYSNASGNLTPNIKWLKDGTTVGTANTLRFDSTFNYQLGRYWWETQNELNVMTKASADLNRQFKY